VEPDTGTKYKNLKQEVEQQRIDVDVCRAKGCQAGDEQLWEERHPACIHSFYHRLQVSRKVGWCQLTHPPWIKRVRASDSGVQATVSEQ